MGLDVYLYRITRPIAEVEKLETQAEAKSEQIAAAVLKAFGASKFEDLKEDQHKSYFDAKKEAYGAAGLDEYGAAIGLEEKIKDIDSKVHPEHMFKIGYLRSSYNSGGINHVLDDVLGEGKNLYYVFEPNDEYRFSPNWGKCHKRAIEIRDAYAKHIAENGSYYVIESFPNLLDPSSSSAIDTTEKALKVFLAEKRKKQESKIQDEDFMSYSNREGTFCFRKEAFPVRGIIPGVSRFGDLRGAYLVVENDEGSKWYRQATEIVVEMCEWVLSQEKPEEFYLHWSS